MPESCHRHRSERGLSLRLSHKRGFAPGPSEAAPLRGPLEAVPHGQPPAEAAPPHAHLEAVASCAPVDGPQHASVAQPDEADGLPVAPVAAERCSRAAAVGAHCCRVAGRSQGRWRAGYSAVVARSVKPAPAGDCFAVDAAQAERSYSRSELPPESLRPDGLSAMRREC